MSSGFKKLLLVAALSVMASTGAFAQDKLVVNFDEGNQPFMYGTATEVKGIYPSLIDAAFKKMGLTIQMGAMPWKRALAEADEGRAGVGGIYKNAAREAKYDFSAPIYQEKLVVYAQKGKGATYAKLDDLNGKTIAVIRGWSYGDEFDAARAAGKFKAEEAESDALNFKKLAADRVDLIVASPLAADPILKKEGLADKIEALPTPLAANDTYLIFNKKAGKADLIKKFNETIAAMKADGSYDKLTKPE